MQYREIKVKIPTRDVEAAGAIAHMIVPYGIYIEDYSDIEEFAPKIAHVDLIEQELLDRDRTHGIIHIYIAPDENPEEAISFLKERLQDIGISYEVEDAAVDEEDWATAWKKYYHPTKIGDRIVVCPSWENYEPKDGETMLVMDPGMAFGTGTHDTTRLCTQLVERYVDAGCDLLDLGTGSGILAIAALLLGARSAVGVDVDEVAVRVAKENAKANRVDDKITFLAGDLTQKVTGQFHVITANIVADVIIRLIPDMSPFLLEGGVFIASGIIDTREADVTAALDAAGYIVTERTESGGWVALAAKRRD